MKWGAGPLQNIALDYLGIAPWNRGRLGVSSFHVADVVSSIKEDGLSRQRYRDVTVVRVPASELQSFRKYNADIAAACPDLAHPTDKLQFACLTKPLGIFTLVVQHTMFGRCFAYLPLLPLWYVRTYVRAYLELFWQESILSVPSSHTMG